MIREHIQSNFTCNLQKILDNLALCQFLLMDKVNKLNFKQHVDKIGLVAVKLKFSQKNAMIYNF